MTFDQLLEAGMTPKQVQWAVRTGALERLHPTVFAVGGSPDSPGRRLRAACLAVEDDAQASHTSALWLWGTRGRHLERVEIVVPRYRSPQLEGVVVHRCRDLDLTSPRLRLGIPVTDPLRSLVDSAAVLPPEQVKEALDRAVGAGLLTVMGALAEVNRVGRPGRRGAGVLRKILAEEGVGGSRKPSVLEAKTRVILRRINLPEDPVCEMTAGENGEYRLDFPFPRVMLDIEVDGWDVHSSAEARDYDYTRQNDLTKLAWAVLRFGWKHIVREPEKTGRIIRDVYFARLAALGSKNDT